LTELVRRSAKPILISVLPEGSQGAIDIFNRNRLAWAPTATGLAAAAAALCEFRSKQERARARMPRTLAAQDISWPAGALTLGEHRAKQVLAAYGIDCVREAVLTEDEVETLQASPLPFPV